MSNYLDRDMARHDARAEEDELNKCHKCGQPLRASEQRTADANKPLIQMECINTTCEAWMVTGTLGSMTETVDDFLAATPPGWETLRERLA